MVVKYYDKLTNIVFYKHSYFLPGNEYQQLLVETQKY